VTDKPFRVAIAGAGMIAQGHLDAAHRSGATVVGMVSGHRVTQLVAWVRTVLPRRAAAGTGTFTGAARHAGATAAVTTEDAVQLLFRTDRGAEGTLTVSQVSSGRKNRLWFETDASTTSAAFDQEHPETLFAGSREATPSRHATRGACPRRPRGSTRCRPATRWATTTASPASSATRYAGAPPSRPTSPPSTTRHAPPD
jgi:predicted dehydrogenase